MCVRACVRPPRCLRRLQVAAAAKPVVERCRRGAPLRQLWDAAPLLELELDPHTNPPPPAQHQQQGQRQQQQQQQPAAA